MICSFLVVNGHHALATTDPYLTGYKWNKTNITYYINPTPTSSEDALDMPLFKEQVNFVVWLWNLYLRDYGAGIQISEATSESSADIVIRFGNSGAGTAARVVITQSSGLEYR